MRARLPANLLLPLPSTSVDRVLASQFWMTATENRRAAGSLANVVSLHRGLSPAGVAEDEAPAPRRS